VIRLKDSVELLEPIIDSVRSTFDIDKRDDKTQDTGRYVNSGELS
jgi:hypothetical protein